MSVAILAITCHRHDAFLVLQRLENFGTTAHMLVTPRLNAAAIAWERMDL